MVIEEYDKNWKNQFNQMKNILEKNLSNMIKIEHDGSTAM
jgi:GrpB-like predicted nucleotidyltransferase (UPF0157 family)